MVKRNTHKAKFGEWDISIYKEDGEIKIGFKSNTPIGLRFTFTKDGEIHVNP